MCPPAGSMKSANWWSSDIPKRRHTASSRRYQRFTELNPWWPFANSLWPGRRLFPDEFNATVFRAALITGIYGDWPGIAQTGSFQPGIDDALSHQPAFDRLGTLFRKRQSNKSRELQKAETAGRKWN